VAAVRPVSLAQHDPESETLPHAAPEGDPVRRDSRWDLAIRVETRGVRPPDLRVAVSIDEGAVDMLAVRAAMVRRTRRATARPIRSQRSIQRLHLPEALPIIEIWYSPPCGHATSSLRPWTNRVRFLRRSGRDDSEESPSVSTQYESFIGIGQFCRRDLPG
jgi:hypothetical protein